MKPLRIIVGLKPVPDPKRWGEITLDPITKTLQRDCIPSVIDPLGKNALEEALKIREAHSGSVVVMSMAPPNTEAILTEALCIGADAAVLLSDRAFAGADTLATSYVLSQGIKKLGEYDLVLCGSRSLDGGTAQVGPQLAEFLGIPHITRVTRVELRGDDSVRVEAKLDSGRQVVDTQLPALLTVEKEINVPRLKCLLGILQARDKSLRVWNAVDLGVDLACVGAAGSPTRVADVYTVAMKRRAEVITGPPDEVATLLAEKLRTLGFLP